MKNEYRISRKKAIERNIEIIKQYAKEQNCSIEESLRDWINEGPEEQWMIDAVTESFASEALT